MMNFRTILQEIRQNRKTTYYFIFAISSVVIFSCLPNFHPDKYINDRYDTRGDLWIHAAAYCLMGILGGILLYPSLRLMVANLVVLMIVSVLMEFVQLIVPERGFSFLDILSNILGIIIAAVVVLVFYKVRK